MADGSLEPALARRVLAQIQASARAEGIVEPAAGAYALRVAILLPTLLALQAVAWMVEGAALMLAAAAISGVVAVQLGFVAHDAGHRSVSRQPAVNDLAGHLAFTIVNGLGFQSWCAGHHAHHAHCQDESRDPDMWTDTVMSLTPGSAAAKTGIGRWLLPYQGYYLWPISLLFAHGLRSQSLRQAYARPRGYPLDVLLLPLHYALWWLVPALALGTGVAQIAAVYLIHSAVVGAYLAALFWVNHIGMPALPAAHGVSVLEQQVVGTRNVRNPRWADPFFGGLNFQIEHHLLPSAPSSRLRKARSIVRPLCLENRVPHHEEGFVQALRSVTRHVHRIAKQAD